MGFSKVCHPEAGFEVLYSRRRGAIRLSCAECDQPIVAIEVAKGEAVQPDHITCRTCGVMCPVSAQLGQAVCLTCGLIELPEASHG